MPRYSNRDTSQDMAWLLAKIARLEQQVARMQAELDALKGLL